MDAINNFAKIVLDDEMYESNTVSLDYETFTIIKKQYINGIICENGHSVRAGRIIKYEFVITSTFADNKINVPIIDKLDKRLLYIDGSITNADIVSYLNNELIADIPTFKANSTLIVSILCTVQ